MHRPHRIPSPPDTLYTLTGTGAGTRSAGGAAAAESSARMAASAVARANSSSGRGAARNGGDSSWYQPDYFCNKYGGVGGSAAAANRYNSRALAVAASSD